MDRIIFNYPRRLVIGENSLQQFAADFQSEGFRRLFILLIPALIDKLQPVITVIGQNGIDIKIYTYTKEEPTFDDFNDVLKDARAFKADSIAGIGGGSVLDVAKLLAAMLYSSLKAENVAGNGLITERKTFLACIPTTSGTGSEVSPNAILLDRKDQLKKGIISPFLVPDNVYIDPLLTVSLSPLVTAFTGIDALTHCVEAFANRYAHPVTDTLALEGIKLICANLVKAVENGGDLEARSNLALASMYGGMCLGPVNTGAVHALAYPLGSIFKVAHGLSNALLLPYVMEYNLSAAVSRYADIARAAGSVNPGNESEVAGDGIRIIKEMIERCRLPLHLSDVGISENDVDKMAESAITVQRLLKNNVKDLNIQDIKDIYHKAL
ncbi:MAG: iron-containing alcohol dehydrogenase [Bacteroidales bacterium]|nr:iron-containing alcohol dehydrogenase [Bacteroidales bacterium]